MTWVDIVTGLLFIASTVWLLTSVAGFVVFIRERRRDRASRCACGRFPMPFGPLLTYHDTAHVIHRVERCHPCAEELT